MFSHNFKNNCAGLSVVEILERGTWSNESTWQRFYKKNIVQIRAENFQDSVMRGIQLRCEQSKQTWATVRWSFGFEECSIISNRNFGKCWNYLMLWSDCRVILILWIKLRKDLILPSHHLHEQYSTVTFIFSFV